MRRNHKSFKPYLIILIVLGLVGVLIFIFTGERSPFKKGEITYDESLTEEEVSFLTDKLQDAKLKNDVTISAETSLTKSTDSASLVSDIFVPVADFYSVESNIKSTDENLKLISISELKSTDKLLSLDGNYFFDDMTKGAEFRILRFDSKDPSEVRDLLKDSFDLPKNSTVLSLTQTGVTALTRGMLTVLTQQGDPTFFSKYIADFLSSSDYTHISNEVSFAEGCSVTSGSTTLCADWRLLDTITDIGTDIVELTGNHNNDYGSEYNIETIKKYQELGLKTFGGGLDEESAKIPLEIADKGAKITLLGFNQSTSTKANGQGADGDHPGANIYDETTAKSQIAEAKANGDFVIVDVQYFECYSYPDEGQEYPTCDAPISGQEAFFKQLIDFGADMVVGTQAHQPQTFELYQGKPIYYGLGNLFFDQIYWPGTTRSIILTHYFWDGELVQTRLTPTQFNESLQTKIMDEETSKWFLSRLAEARAE